VLCSVPFVTIIYTRTRQGHSLTTGNNILRALVTCAYIYIDIYIYIFKVFYREDKYIFKLAFNRSVVCKSAFKIQNILQQDNYFRREKCYNALK